MRRMTLNEKTAKFVLLFAVIGLALWALIAGEAPHQQAAPGGFRDTELYRAASEQSGGYYERVIDLHRAHGYPLKPFYTVRLPTLATVTAAVGPDTMGMLLWFLLAAGVVAWLYRLREAHFLERLAAVFLFGLFAPPPVDFDLLPRRVGRNAAGRRLGMGPGNVRLPGSHRTGIDLSLSPRRHRRFILRETTRFRTSCRRGGGGNCDLYSRIDRFQPHDGGRSPKRWLAGAKGAGRVR